MAKISKFFHRGDVAIFLLILLFAAFLRLYKLTSIPPGVNRDEASIGFTALSLLKTGKDEYGRSFPLSFQSFGDWKLPLYIYTTVPFVATLGVTELAVRLPSALAGIATVGLTYALVMALFNNSTLGLLAMTATAISPWHIHLSRVESESNMAVFFTTLGVLYFLRGLKDAKRAYYIVIAALLFALTYYTYHGNHIFTTLFVGILFFLYRPDRIRKRETWISAILFLLLSGFIFTKTLSSADRTKISGIGIFGNPTVIHANIELPRNEHANLNSLTAIFVHNRVIYTIDTIVKNYLQGFSPDFLFIKGGGNHAHNIEGFGNMYPIDALFLVLGVAALLGILKSREALLLLLWIAIAPIAPSITKDAPHTNRMFAIFPALPIAVAYGWFWFGSLVKTHKKIFIPIISIVILVYSAYVFLYLERYYIHFPRNETMYWGAPYKDLSSILTRPDLAQKHVIISHPEYSPYVFLLFYTSYDPAAYQRGAVRYPSTADDFVHVKNFGRFEFRAIDWAQDMKNKDTLLIDDPRDIPGTIYSGQGHIADVTLPDGTIQFGIIETGR